MTSLPAIARGKPARFVVPFVLTLVWTLLDFISIFAMGFVRVDLDWFISLAAKIIVLAANVFFIRRFFAREEKDLYTAFRKYAGYASVGVYVTLNLPASEWSTLGLTGPAEAIFFWIFAALNAAFAAALWISLRLKKSMIYWSFMSPEEAADKKLLKEHVRARTRPLFSVVLDTLDVFIQTVILVVIIEQFVVQLYVIPSESLVPTFLIGDRPVVLKALDGPEIPLSPLKIPVAAAVREGQVVVFENPVYTKPPVLTGLVQQFLFFGTLSIVNLDVDSDGQPREHYIVKRVVGVPGEQLMMVNDVLYVRRKGETEFKPSAVDKAHAYTDLYALPENIKRRVQMVPLGQKDRELITKWDGIVANSNPDELRKNGAELVAAIRAQLSGIGELQISAYERQFFGASQDTAALSYSTHATEWESQKDPGDSTRVLAYQTGAGTLYVQTLIDRILRDKSERDAFLAFLASGLDADSGSMNLYELRAHELNLLYKQSLAGLYQAILSHVLSEDGAYSRDVRIQNQAIRAGEIWQYIIGPSPGLANYDARNFPVFPNDGPIPENKYFLMGDNRYNSLDFRFKESVEQPHGFATFKNIDPFDPFSLRYYSSVGPRLLDRSAIIGRVIFRVFPFDRIGPVGN